MIVRKTLNQTRGTAGDEGTDAERNREAGNDGREHERKGRDTVCYFIVLKQSE